MRTTKEGLYSSVMARLGNTPLFSEEGLTQPDQDFLFAMRCNGYFLLNNGDWKFRSETLYPLTEEFKSQRVSFFGPASSDEFFFNKRVNRAHFSDPFARPSVTTAIRKYRDIDEDQAARIAFILGGIVRHIKLEAFGPVDTTDKIIRAVESAAHLTRLGDKRSGDAIASAIAMYIISGGSLKKDSSFEGSVFHMAEAVSEDPVVPKETRDLGLSQTLRLRNFFHKIERERPRPHPDIAELIPDLYEFPTVGAEFHFPENAPYQYPAFWQRLAILNMSQYQRGSYVQLSRNDKGVIEVRINPSVYPITIANWNHIRRLLPELNQTFFSITINRKNDRDFHWDNGDRPLLDKLRALGMLSYAGLFGNNPLMRKPEEVGFGSVYLGQTVKMFAGEYDFTGNWGGGEGQYGQMAIYTGFGENFPYLAYYLSMVLHNQNVLESIPNDLLARIRTLSDALNLEATYGNRIFTAIQSNVAADEKINKAYEAGNRIVELLNP
ncbi:MAG: hypothetical protein Q7S44_03580 [bacterium]|nr:hypothetical protein [bacterium]